MKLLIVVTLFTFLSSLAFAKDPNCAGVNRWPTKMAFGSLKNAGITDNNKVDFSKTNTTRVASEKISKDLYRQVHHVKFSEKSGNTIEVITVSDASNEECSMGSVKVFLITKRLEK